MASWDGKALRLWLQGAGGKFPAQGSRVAIGAPGCVGLSALDVGAAGRPGLLVSTSVAPILLRPGRGGAFKATGLFHGAMTVKNFGAAGRCLVADFDGDGLVDVLQPFATRSLVYRGTGPGAFAVQRACSVALGTGRGAAVLGDYDHDGRFDITCVAEDACRLWHNRGGLSFAESVRMAGEIRYTAQPGGIAGTTCDINNDGRQDLMLVYAAQIVQLFFSRGFFNLGKALTLIWQDPVFGESEEGQWAGTVADLNGDGAQDMALVLRNGRVRVYIREVFEDEPPLAVRAALPLGGSFAGPLRVTGWAGTRCLGAWNVVPGTREAFFGTQEPGELTLRWRFPGAKEQTRKAVLEDKSFRLLLTPK